MPVIQASTGSYASTVAWLGAVAATLSETPSACLRIDSHLNECRSGSFSLHPVPDIWSPSSEDSDCQQPLSVLDLDVRRSGLPDQLTISRWG